MTIFGEILLSVGHDGTINTWDVTNFHIPHLVFKPNGKSHRRQFVTSMMYSDSFSENLKSVIISLDCTDLERNSKKTATVDQRSQIQEVYQ
jgi:hypothetical protein